MVLRLDNIVVRTDPAAEVLFLPGGQPSSFKPVRNRHASWWRVAVLAWSLGWWARKENVSMALLQYDVRGWNSDTDPSPVKDARWALEKLRQRRSTASVPIVLVGHSMGGRTACRLADEPSVVAVIALAPWLPKGEPVDQCLHSRLDVLHGTADRWTSPTLSRAFVDRVAARGGSARWTPLAGSGHFMLRTPGVWKHFVADAVQASIGSERTGPGRKR